MFWNNNNNPQTVNPQYVVQQPNPNSFNGFVQESARRMQEVQSYNQMDAMNCKQMMDEVAMFSAYEQYLTEQAPTGAERYRTIVDNYTLQLLNNNRRPFRW